MIDNVPEEMNLKAMFEGSAKDVPRLGPGGGRGWVGLGLRY